MKFASLLRLIVCQAGGNMAIVDHLLKTAFNLLVFKAADPSEQIASSKLTDEKVIRAQTLFYSMDCFTGESQFTWLTNDQNF
ncbi:hypothetical protein T4B_9780 [Trichinella pseudospiralis]|uniref:Uncharacterized protein n=1 Tax=Trichinella pseudospiralis TaxID=6337 RepID=A0A0V1IYE6_TRIPS|nr:hypothetical protein T4B_9780 [Trichinella pseudospiralis]